MISDLQWSHPCAGEVREGIESLGGVTSVPVQMYKRAKLVLGNDF